MRRPSTSIAPARPGGRRRLLAGLLGLAALGVLHPGVAWNADRMSQAAARLGPTAREGVRELQALLGTIGRLDESRRAVAVNDFFNRRVAFAEDIDVWGVADHWSSPLETLHRGRGDCEDFAIGKYFVLRAAGVPARRLRLVYVRAEVAGRELSSGMSAVPHLVLAWYPADGAEPLVLDNLAAEVLPASRRTDLSPVFSFNSEGLWQGVAGATAGDPLQRLSKWREVLTRAREEGFE